MTMVKSNILADSFKVFYREFIFAPKNSKSQKSFNDVSNIPIFLAVNLESKLNQYYYPKFKILKLFIFEKKKYIFFADSSSKYDIQVIKCVEFSLWTSIGYIF
ncbi:hypothetical protein pb186bvf_004940 [Paramecium bursaria]